MVSEQLGLGLVRKSGKWKPRVVLESKNNERALGNFKSFNKDRKLKYNTPYAIHEFCDTYYLIYV
jgi:hypothetical protein